MNKKIEQRIIREWGSLCINILYIKMIQPNRQLLKKTVIKNTSLLIKSCLNKTLKRRIRHKCIWHLFHSNKVPRVSCFVLNGWKCHTFKILIQKRLIRPIITNMVMQRTTSGVIPVYHRFAWPSKIVLFRRILAKNNSFYCSIIRKTLGRRTFPVLDSRSWPRMFSYWLLFGQ